MKRFLSVMIGICGLATSGLSEEAGPPVVPEIATESKLPGVALAQGITEITGVAISPLLGVSGLGAWEYFNTAEERRADLAWYCQPWAWGTGMVILSLVFLKDTLGAGAPGIFKKPFDVAELFEDKASALVASAAFVPLVAREISRGDQIEVPLGVIGLQQMALLDLWWLTVPAAILAFGVVWVCSHSINVLIILSPFALVDTALKLMRASLLATVVASYWIAPWLGAALCLVIIAVAAWFAPSALRLSVFGTRFAADVVLWKRSRRRATPDRPHVFTVRKVGGLPRRIGGRLVPTETGGLEFRYKRLGVMPEQVVELPAGRREVVKGLLAPSLVEAGAKEFIFLPRYRGSEEAMVGKLAFAGVRENGFVRGWAAVKSWWRGGQAKPGAVTQL